VLVEVTVSDVDDEPARFERSWYRYELFENEPGGTAVGQVHAVDLDLPPFNHFHYRLHSTNNASESFIDPGRCGLLLQISHVAWSVSVC